MGRNLYYEDEILEEKFNGFMFKRLLSYAAEYKWDYIKAAILLSGAAFLSLVPTAINMKIINDTIILFQFNQTTILVIPLKIQNIANIRTAPTVNTLVRVANRTDIAAALRQ